MTVENYKEYDVVVDYFGDDLVARAVININEGCLGVTYTGMYIVRVKARDAEEAKWIGLAKALQNFANSLKAELRDKDKRLGLSEDRAKDFKYDGIIGMIRTIFRK